MAQIVQTKNTTTGVTVTSQHGDVTEQVDQCLLPKPPQAMTQLIGMLYMYSELGWNYLAELQEYTQNQLDASVLRPQWLNMLEEQSTQDDGAADEAFTSLVGLIMTQSPNTVAIDAIREKITALVIEKLMVTPPYKGEGTPFYAPADDLLNYAKAAIKVNTDLYADLTAIVADMKNVSEEEMEQVHAEVNGRFISANYLPLAAFGAEILRCVSTIKESNLNRINELCLYLDPSYYVACHLGGEGFTRLGQ